MESEIQTTAKPNINETLKKKLLKPTVLDSFTNLKSDSEKERVKSAVDLIKHLNFITDEVKKEQEYNCVLSRLVRGVGSSKTNARSGFYSALVALLTNSCIFNVSDVLNAIEKHLNVEEDISKNEIADVSMGNILVCGALIQSGMFMKATGGEQKKIIEILLTSAKKRSYLSLASYTFIAEIIEKADEQFKNIWQVLEFEISRSWTEHNLETLYILCIANNKFPDTITKKFLKNTLGVSKIVHETSLDSLCDKLLSDAEIIKLKHPVYEEVAKIVVKESLVPQMCAEMDKHLQKFNRNRQLIMTHILNSTLQNLTDTSQIPDMLTENYITNTLTTFEKTKQQTNDEFFTKTNTMFNLLTQKLNSEEVSEETKTAVVKKLLLYPGTLMFQNVTKTKVITNLIAKFKAESVINVAKLFEKVVTARKKKVVGPKKKRNWTNVERIYATQNLVQLIGHSSVQDEVEWKLEYVKLLFRMGLCVDETNSVGSELACACKNCFYNALDIKFPKLENMRSFLSSLVTYINEEIFLNSALQLRKPLSEKATKCWKDMIILLSKLEKDSQPAENIILVEFNILALHAGLQTFSNFRIAKNALQELWSCSDRLQTDRFQSEPKLGAVQGTQTGKSPKKLKAGKGELSKKVQSESEEPMWIEVIVDLLLSWLSQESHLMRTIINSVFPHLCPQLTPTAIRHILNVFDQKYHNPLSDSEGESGESDAENSGDDSSDDEASEEESGSEDSGLDYEDEEEEARLDKLRMAVRAALHKAGHQTDDESEDMDEMDEEEGAKIDKALTDAFRKVKPSQKKSNQQSQRDKLLMHFRLRALDMVEIYLTSSDPSMLQCLEIGYVLMNTLEFSIRDPHQTALENRLRNCLKKVYTMKKFGSAEDVTDQTLADMWKLFLEKGKKTTAIFQNMTNIRAELSALVIRCSISLQGNLNRKEFWVKSEASKVAEMFTNLVENHLKNNETLLPLAFFKNVLQLNWYQVATVVPFLFNFAFDSSIKPFRRIPALQFLNVIYNGRLRTENMEEFQQLVEPFEVELSEKTVDLLTSLCKTEEINATRKFISALFDLLATIKIKSNSPNLNWPQIGESIKTYACSVTFTTDTKKSYNEICRVLQLHLGAKQKQRAKKNEAVVEKDKSTKINGFSTGTKPVDEILDENAHEATDESAEEDMGGKILDENTERQKGKKRKKSSGKEAQQKKEAKLLRMKTSAEGLSDKIAFSQISLANIDTDEEEDQKTVNTNKTNGKMKKKKFSKSLTSLNEVENNSSVKNNKSNKKMQNKFSKSLTNINTDLGNSKNDKIKNKLKKKRRLSEQNEFETGKNYESAPKKMKQKRKVPKENGL